MSAWIVRHRRAVALAGAVFAAAAVFALVRWMRVDPDVSSLFPKDDPTLRLTRALQGDRGPSRTLLVILRGFRSIHAADRAAEALRKSPLVARVEATREEWGGAAAEWARRAPAWYLPEHALADLGERLAGPGRREAVEAIKRRIAEDPAGGKRLALADPLEVRWILSRAEERAENRMFRVPLAPWSRYMVFAGEVALIRVIGQRDSFDIDYANALLADVRSRLVEWQPELAGGYVSASWNAARMERDMKLQAVVSALLVMAFLWAFTRSVVAAHLLIVPVAVSLAATLALGTMVVGPLTLLAVGVIAVMIGMGIDYPIHLFSHYRARRAVEEPVPAMEHALGALGRPFVGAVATTVAPLLVLLASGFPGFRQFGGLLACGIVVSVLLSLTVLVPLLLWSDRFARNTSPYRPWAVRGAAAVLGSRARVPVAVAIGALALVAWAGVGAGGVAVDLDLRNVMAAGDPGVEALDRLEGELGFALTPVIALVDDPLAARGLEWSRVAAAFGVHELIPADDVEARGRAFQSSIEGWVEGTLREMKAAGLAPEPFRPSLESLDAQLRRPAPTLDELRSSFTHEGRWVVTMLPRRGLWRPEERRAFDEEARRALGEGAGLYSAYHLPDHSASLLKRDLARVGGWGLAAIVVVAMLATRSVTGGLLALVPMIAGVGVTLGASRLFGMSMNLFNFEALPILMGTGIDHGIYFVTHARAHRGESAADAVRATGPGMWGTMAATAIGFGAIAFSSQPGLASMGVLVAAGMAAAFAASTLLLPVISLRR